jgi:DNA repair protein RadC
MEIPNKNVHQGHRERVKKSVFENGFESMQSHQVLEYLLFFVVPYKDTNVIAHDLIERFGSFDRVLDASVNDLAKIKGMTKNAALFLHSLPETFSFYARKKNAPKQILNVNNVIPYLRSLVSLKTKEHLYIICLDSKNAIIHTEQLASGNSSVFLSAKEIVNIAMLHQAKSVILCHNHPSDIVLPSDADINSTASIRHTLSVLDIKLLDHIIIGENTAYSFFLKSVLKENPN